MNTQPVHSTHSNDAVTTASPPKPPTRVADEATQHVDSVHAAAQTASSNLFQNAHTPTGTRVDTHK
jgi:hypothetical protein